MEMERARERERAQPKFPASYFSMKSVVVNGSTLDQAVSSTIGIVIALYMTCVSARYLFPSLPSLLIDRTALALPKMMLERERERGINNSCESI